MKDIVIKIHNTGIEISSTIVSMSENIPNKQIVDNLKLQIALLWLDNYHTKIRESLTNATFTPDILRSSIGYEATFVYANSLGDGLRKSGCLLKDDDPSLRDADAAQQAGKEAQNEIKSHFVKFRQVFKLALEESASSGQDSRTHTPSFLESLQGVAKRFGEEISNHLPIMSRNMPNKQVVDNLKLQIALSSLDGFHTKICGESSHKDR